MGAGVGSRGAIPVGPFGAKALCWECLPGVSPPATFRRRCAAERGDLRSVWCRGRETGHNRRLGERTQPNVARPETTCVDF
jgi:hypothetical protein